MPPVHPLDGTTLIMTRQGNGLFIGTRHKRPILGLWGMPIESLSSRKRCDDSEDARLLVDGDSKTNGDISSEDPAIEIEDLDSIHEILNIFKAFI